jgi:hypothetical protein
MHSNTGSPIWRRFLVENLYNPLALLTRGRNQAWNVPRHNLIEFGITFDI